MSPATTNLLIGFVNDFLIVAGGIISGAMLATKEVSMPTTPVLVLALVMGVVQAARRAQSKMDPPVTTAARTPEHLVAQIRANEALVADTVARVLTQVPPVTPQRADDQKPTKDSS